MYQGLLGTFPFTVTELEVSTFRDLKFSRCFLKHFAKYEGVLKPTA